MQPLYLKKRGGARMKDVSSYVVHCNADQVRAQTSLKYGDEVDEDDFVHVSLAKLAKKHPVVVKVHMSHSEFAKREVKFLKLLRGNRNVVQYICDFECKDSLERWKMPLNQSSSLCLATGKDMLHFIVIEYIENGDLASWMRNTIDEKTITTFFMQTAMILIDFGFKYRFMHGDINSGNILVRKTQKERLKYSFPDGKYIYVSTHGFMPIFLDFGRSYELDHGYKSKAIRFIVLQEILAAYIVMANYMGPDLKSRAMAFIHRETASNRNNLELLLENTRSMF